MKKKFKITFNAPVTLGFAAVCFIATMLGIITSGGMLALVHCKECVF